MQGIVPIQSIKYSPIFCKTICIPSSWLSTKGATLKTYLFLYITVIKIYTDQQMNKICFFLLSAFQLYQIFDKLLWNEIFYKRNSYFRNILNQHPQKRTYLSFISTYWSADFPLLNISLCGLLPTLISSKSPWLLTPLLARNKYSYAPIPDGVK